MLNILKRDLVARENATTIPELMMESAANDDIRDAFLDNVNYMLMGTENDPKVENEIASIPEFDDDELTDDELRELEGLEESIEEIPEFEEE